jgi:drug/metabolite transporter (DMT)-like permease
LAGGLGFDALAYGAVWLALLCYVAAGTLIRFVRRTSVTMMTAINMGVAVVALVPALVVMGTPFPAMTPPALLAALYLGLVCTGLAYLLRTHITLTIGQTYMSMASYFMPITGVLLAAAILGEPLTGRTLLALACVVMGFAVSRRRPTTASAAETATPPAPPLPAPQRE